MVKCFLNRFFDNPGKPARMIYTPTQNYSHYDISRKDAKNDKIK